MTHCWQLCSIKTSDILGQSVRILTSCDPFDKELSEATFLQFGCCACTCEGNVGNQEVPPFSETPPYYPQSKPLCCSPGLLQKPPICPLSLRLFSKLDQSVPLRIIGKLIVKNIPCSRPKRHRGGKQERKDKKIRLSKTQTFD